MAKDVVESEGVVVDIHPGFSIVRLDNNHDVMCVLNGKMRMNHINILKGDRVKIEMSPYDLTRGRICWRL